MFSALKKLAGKNEPPPAVVPGNVQAMSSQLQRKFARGIQYNMKIVIKGDNNVGKTCLFNRLQGKPFSEVYESTPEIQVASIQWSYKATDDVVKVEIWDVVDKAKKKKKMEGLKLENSSAAAPVPEEAALDAEFLDVYKGTHGVVMVLDITKAWTFEYVQRELPRVPGHIPVLVLGNHRDMGHHRQVREDDVRFFAEHAERTGGAAQVRYAESSMRNGFGLKLLHRFLNVPFLTLQRECLLTQLATNERETEATHQELDLYEESEDANYDVFLDHLTNRRRQTADSQAPSQKIPHSQTTTALSSAAGRASAGSPDKRNVDAFVPDGGLDADFLDDTTPQQTPVRGQQQPQQRADSDSDDDDAGGGNPMVAGFQEELDELDLLPSPATRVSAARPAPPDSSDDELPPPAAAAESPGRRRRDARLVASPTPDESVASVTTIESEPELTQRAEPDSGAEAAVKSKKKKKKDKEKDKEVGADFTTCIFIIETAGYCLGHRNSARSRADKSDSPGR
ncbi:Rab-like protein 6 [Amphibalanus amphitrite]|uniref:Rab-like protein 6 n=1 Tax=Amphibalanus amphitrite TaxID=1232801 RepID=A0A6A4X393_AMPAM|nr:Rab-like protein 6 [Amphibalanus amphitrite]KAF0311959.1 Rab-like protein 6 [Amphibalanus amphitrite]